MKTGINNTTMKLWMLVISLVVSPVVTLNPCKQPIGMENGLIKDDQIKLFDADDVSMKTSVRLKSITSCNKITGVEVNLRRFMTITGFAFQSDTNIDGIVVRYGVDGDYENAPWKTKYKFNLIMQDKDNREARTFNYTKEKNEIEEIMFEDHPFSLLYIKIELPSKSCFKFELFGCADICSSPLTSPSLFQSNEMVNNDWLTSWCPRDKNTKDVKMTKSVTFTGLIIHKIDALNLVNLTVTCKNDSSNVKQYKIEQKSSQQNISFWFDEQNLCDEISLTSSSMNHCVNISLIGCKSDCMSRLDIGSAYRGRDDDSFDAVLMKASSWIGVLVPDTSEIYPQIPIQGFLSNIGGSWLANETDDRDPWIQVCFKKTVLVSGIAIQAQGFFGFGRIKSYVLGYSYDDSRTNVFMYSNNGTYERSPGPMSRFQTIVDPLHTPVTAKCFELRQLNCILRCAIRFDLLGCNTTTVKPSVTIETQQKIGSGLGKTITCSIYGQPGTSLQWKNISGVTIKNNSYYTTSTNVNNISELNVSYSFTLHMTKEMREYWGRSELNCNNGEKIVNCSSVFTCTAFYVGDENVEKQTNVIFQFNRTVATPTVKILNTTDTSATLSLNNPDSIGDFPAVGLNVTVFDENGTMVSENTTSNSILVVALLPIKNYTMQVHAYNRFNIASHSVQLNTTTKGASPPRNLRLSNQTETSLTLSWEQPDIVEGRITGFTLECRKGRYEVLSNTCSTNCTTSLTIDGLAPNSRYWCKVRALVDDEFDGYWSDKTSGETSIGTPCQQSVGIGNGMIVDLNIKINNITSRNVRSNISIRLSNDLCADDTSSVQVDLRRLMAITGLAFYSDVQTEATIRFGIDDENLRNNFSILWSGNSTTNERKFPVKNGFTRMWFENDPFTLRYIKVIFSQIACVQLEIYGCAESCSSHLTLPILSNIMTNQNTTSNNSMKTTIQLRKSITISGLMLFPQTSSVEVSLNCSNGSQNTTQSFMVPANTEEGITVWFEGFVCKDIEFGYSNGALHGNVSFLGCDSECTRKLGIQRTSLTASSSQPNHEASESYLNNMKGSWLATKGEEQWIQACFNDSVLVSGVAIQSQGNQGYARLSFFTLSISYEPSRNKSFVYRYNDNMSIFSGPSSRYGTKVNQLNIAVTGKCFSLTNMTCIGACALRWELIGCKIGMKPQVYIARNATFTDKSNMILKCAIHGQPRTTLLWEIDGSMITNNDYYNVSSLVERRTSDLNISYTSHLGISNKILNYFVNKTESQCKVTDVNNTIDCTLTYTCKAFYVENEAVEEETVAVFKYNGTVDAPLVKLNTTDTFANLSLKHPESIGDFPAVGFNVSVFDKDGTKVFENTTSESILVVALLPNENYTVKVYAYNRFNIISFPVQLDIKTKGSSSPLNITVKNVSDKSLTITWDRPDIVEGTITGYTLQCSKGRYEVLSNTCSTNCTTSLTIGGLAPNSRYLCKVNAKVNDKYEGPWSINQLFETSSGAPCQQSVGMRNGMVVDSSIKINNSTANDTTRNGSIRLSNDSCAGDTSNVQVDLVRLMTITGLAFYSDVQTEVTIRFGIDDEILQNNFNILWGGNSTTIERKFQVKNGFTRMWFEDDPFTLRYIKMMFSQNACVQLEIYGCAEICSSHLTLPILSNNMANQNTSNNSMKTTIQLRRSTTISGLMLLSQPSSVEVSLDCSNGSENTTQSFTVPANTEDGITVWFEEDLVCKDIEVGYSNGTLHGNISFLGCDFECSLKLGIQNSNLTSSSGHSSTYLSYLNNMNGSWVASAGDNSSWIQVCFKNSVRVSAVALQSEGSNGYRRILAYVLSVGYGLLTNDSFSYNANGAPKIFPGPSSRYGTKVNQLDIPVTGRCFSLTNMTCIGACAVRWELLGCKQGWQPQVYMSRNATFANKSNMSLKCAIYGQPRTTIRWEIDGSMITNDDYYNVSSLVERRTSDLNISYTSHLGISNKILNLNFVNRTDSQCEVTDVNNTIDCTLTYTCKAFYVESEAIKKDIVVSFKYNGKVRIPMINRTSSTNTSIAFSISPQMGDDFPVVGYNVSVKDAYGKFMYNNITVKSLIWVHDLTSVQNFTVQVYAYNNFNITSNPAHLIISTKGATKPRNIETLTKTDKSLTITWDRPYIVEGRITGYTLQCRKGRYEVLSNTCSTNCTTSLTIDGLAPISRYWCKVKAVIDALYQASWSEGKYFNTLQGAPCQQSVGMGNGMINDTNIVMNNFVANNITTNNITTNNITTNNITTNNITTNNITTNNITTNNITTNNITTNNITTNNITTNNITTNNITTNNITTNNITRNGSIRLNNDLCAGDTSNVQVDLRRLMTITGLAFYSDVATEVTIQFGVIDDENLQNYFNILWRGNSTTNKRKFQLKKGFTRMWFEDDPFTLRYIKMIFSQIACVQLEIYGCAEICSSRLTLPTLSKNMRNQNTSNNSMKTTISLTRPITISGLMLLPQPKSVQLSLNCPSDSPNLAYSLTVPANADEGVTIWFEENLICRELAFVHTNLNHSNVKFLGCDSECSLKLGVQNSNLTSSSGHSSTYLSYLNNMNGSWVASTGDNSSWIKSCFKNSVRVSAVSLQSEGSKGYRRISSYVLSVGYGSSTNDSFSYNENDTSMTFPGPSSRYGTKVNQLDTAVTGRCFSLTNMTCIGACAVRWELIGCEQGLKPQVYIARNATFTDKDNMSLKCAIHGQPRTTLLWEIDGSMITNNDYYNVSSLVERRNSDLNISYTSHLGISNKILNYFVNRTDSQCEVTDVNNTIDCTLTYTCKAFYVENEAVEKETVAVFKYSGDVGMPKITSINATNTSAFILWQPSRDFFSAVSYNVSLTDMKTEKVVFRNITHKTNIMLNYLYVYREYQFRVISSNRFNITSQASVREFMTSQLAPSNVKNFKVSVNSSNEIHVTWNRPSDVRGILSSYFIEWIDGNGNGNKTDTNETQLAITGLEAFTNYTVKLRASTNDNELLGTWSSSTVKTMEGIPTLPIDLEAIKENDARIKIQWMKPNKMNGIFKRYQIVYTATKDYYREYDHVRSDHTSITEFIIEDILPGTNYTIYVQAVSGGGAGYNATIVHTTVYGEPNVANMTLSENAVEQKEIQLSPIPPLTGPIKYYELAVSTGESNTDCYEGPLFINQFTMGTSKQIVVRKSVETVQFGKNNFTLKLIGVYRFCLRAVVNDGLLGKPKEVIIERRDLEPLPPPVVGGTRITIKVSKGPENIRFYIIIVSQKNASSLDKNDLSNLRGYDEQNPTKPYITAVFKTYVEQFIVGDGKTYSYSNKRKRSLRSLERYQNVQNVKLKLDTEYFVSVRAHGSETIYYSSPWKSSKTLKSDITTNADQKNKAPDHTIPIVISVIAVVVVVCVIVAFIIVRRRQQPRERKGESKRFLNDVTGVDNNGVQMDEFPEKVVESPPENVVINSNYPPVRLIDFPIYWEDLNKDEHKRVTEEYQALDCGQLFQWTEAVIPELKTKNRYANIVAYNHSRVKLKELNEINSDYVNASFIHGYSTKNMYIASQGPNVASMCDFWRMVWEQNVSVIVMLTNLVEKNKRKCEQYWPENGEETYGDLKITITNVQTFTNYIVRTFLIKKTDSNQTRNLHHYHFTSWPDHGVPEFPCDLLNFHNKVRKNHPLESLHSPMLVHCSAGVGRTGTFIGIDNMLKLAKEREVVDVFNYVNFMRSRRIHMVQTESQFMFAYHALYEVLTCGITLIEASNLSEENEMMSRPNQHNTGKNGYQLQFERLEVVTIELTHADTLSALKETNTYKNRTSILPADVSRVLLTTAGDQDYINAVHVNGYEKKDAFIATQHPLQNTVEDFWRMVFEKKVSTIVMLNSLEENKSFEMFWPIHKSTLKFGSITLSCDNERMEQSISKMTLNIEESDNDEVVQTLLISYKRWPEDDVPKNIDELIRLVELVDQNQANVEQPIVVMCSDGAGRSGTFIAISILMEQLKMEQTVDVFQTVKKIRTVRPEFLQNVKQYQLCYNTAQVYLDSFSTYSNFSA